MIEDQVNFNPSPGQNAVASPKREDEGPANDNIAAPSPQQPAPVNDLSAASEEVCEKAPPKLEFDLRADYYKNARDWVESLAEGRMQNAERDKKPIKWEQAWEMSVDRILRSSYANYYEQEPVKYRRIVQIYSDPRVCNPAPVKFNIVPDPEPVRRPGVGYYVDRPPFYHESTGILLPPVTYRPPDLIPK